MAFGDHLQEVRKRSGLTQEEFAEQLQVSRQAVSKWESGRGYPEMDKVLYICSRYGTTMDELFTDELPARQPGVPQETRALPSHTLGSALSDFYSNLSPYNKMIGIFLLCVIALLGPAYVYCMRSLKGGADDVMTIICIAAIIIFGIAEAATAGLVSIWFAAGALAALICALLHGPVWLQGVWFVVISGLTLILTRPLVKKYVNAKSVATNADRNIGRSAVVTEKVDNLAGVGTVKLDGVLWSARSVNDAPIEEGTTVVVREIRGVKLLVEPESGE